MASKLNNTAPITLVKEKNLMLLLVGKSGGGKTATLRSVVQETGIKARGGWESVVTEGCQSGEITFQGRSISAVDTLGLFSTQMTSEQQQLEWFEKSISEAFQRCPDGFDALVLVIPYGERLMEEGRKTIEILKELFGPKWLRKHGVVVITRGDAFLHDLKDKESFEEKCRRIPGFMGDVLRESAFRCVLFDNVTEDEAVINEQREKLVSVIDKVRIIHGRYTEDKVRYRTKSHINWSFPSVSVFVHKVLQRISSFWSSRSVIVTPRRGSEV